jgi:hypothetical protein
VRIIIKKGEDGHLGSKRGENTTVCDWRLALV